jgi:hypothetical protein
MSYLRIRGYVGTVMVLDRSEATSHKLLFSPPVHCLVDYIAVLYDDSLSLGASVGEFAMRSGVPATKGLNFRMLSC